MQTLHTLNHILKGRGQRAHFLYPEVFLLPHKISSEQLRLQEQDLYSQHR